MSDYIGLRVARWRDISGMTQHDLASAVGVTPAYISMLENGRRPVAKRSLLIALASALQVSITDLTGQPATPRSSDDLAIYGAVPALRGALDDEPEAGPLPSLADVASRTDAVMSARMACDYQSLARLLPHIRINVADPGMTATDLSGGEGHSVHDGTDAILAFALGAPCGPSGTFADRDGALPW